MAHVTSEPAVATVADLLEALGGVPAHRVRLKPPPGTASEQDVLELHAREKRLCELVDGVLVEKPMGFYESRLACVLIQLLSNFADEHDLGIIVGPDGMMRLAVGLVRIPDVSFVSWHQLSNRRIPRQPIPDLAPDLAVEVLSPGNTEAEMARKLREYFSAGVRLVWLLDPETRTMRVYTSPGDFSTMSEDESLDGGEVLPGFTLPLRDLFERAARSERRNR